MINYWLIIVAAIMSILILGIVFYLIVLYSSEDDKNQAWLPKIIVVLGLSLACFTVLLLPYDVANRKDPTRFASYGGGLDTALMWQIALWSIAVFTIVIVPFTTFYYEAWDPDQQGLSDQIKPAILYTVGSLISFTAMLLILWFTVGYADIPYQKYAKFGQYTGNSTSTVIDLTESWADDTLSLQVSIFVYVVGLMSTLGWVAFVFFAGVGLATLPIDLIMDWVQRPKPLALDAYARAKEDIANRSVFLTGIGKKLEEKQRAGAGGSRSFLKKVNLLKNEVWELENKYERLETSYKDRGGSPFLSWGLFLLGVLSGFLSLLWILQIIIYNLANVDPFLNTFFISLDSAFSLLGTIAYGVFSFYLLWAVVKGLFRLGVRLLFFTVHPMKLGETLMNSFLFNTMIVLICSITVTQFCASSFREYAANTAVDSMFATYVMRLRGIGYVMVYMPYALLFNIVVALGCQLCCPKKPAVDSSEFDAD